ncbi:ROK family transcriptional regulator [Rhizobium leguminosarum]|nr:ROK family transcriptional regulator [Rhizobium leguminosarum]TAX11242.1 ROK family transcriptional regulator [Rhizobium leguminosarum]TAY14186.1 ROK family transcriptional regulator [Rhizobium leguminosarum]TAZ15910.1 ROK family transcriptional regulator [Rhizobium leguminosarum]
MRMKGDQSTTRLINRRLVLDCLRRQGQVTRMDLVAYTRLSPAAISGVVGELMDEGFVIEGEAARSSGGRKPVLVSINYGFRVSIGIKLMHDRIDAMMTDLSTKPIGFTSIKIQSTAIEEVSRATIAAVSELMPDPIQRHEMLLGVGVAMPGFIDALRGICLHSPRLGWDNVGVAQVLAGAVGKPVWVDNDVNAYAIAQNLFGLSRLRRSSLVLILGTGVGAAVMIGGQVHRGGRFMAGEVGYTVDQPGRSWSDMFSEPAMEADWQTLCQKQARANNGLSAASAEQDADALAFLYERGVRVGQHLAGLINMLDPEVVIIGGEAMRFGPAFTDAIQSSLQEFTLGELPEIAIDWTNDIWSRAAAALAIQSFFDFESVSGMRGPST